MRPETVVKRALRRAARTPLESASRRRPRRRRYRGDDPKARRWRLLLLLIGLSLGLILALGAVWEVRTSSVQSWFFARWSAELRYTVEAAPSTRIAFPREGPFDERRGYTRLPAFSERLQTDGYHIAEQAHQAPALTRLILNGIPPPYPESPVAALVIHDNTGHVMFDAGAGEPVFHDVAEIPPLITQTLLFIENRRIGLSADDQPGLYANPAIDWQRSTKALISYAVRKVGIDMPLQGGALWRPSWRNTNTPTAGARRLHRTSCARCSQPVSLRTILGAIRAAHVYKSSWTTSTRCH